MNRKNIYRQLMGLLVQKVFFPVNCRGTISVDLPVEEKQIYPTVQYMNIKAPPNVMGTNQQVAVVGFTNSCMMRYSESTGSNGAVLAAVIR